MTCLQPYNREEWIVEAEKHFSEWDRSLYEWKSFKLDQSALLRSYVGLALFNIPERCKTSNDEMNPPALEDIESYYSDDKREIISEIVKKLKFANNEIILSHTFLFLDTEPNIICVFRQLTSEEEIIFIDHYGRVYSSWHHFCQTNRLPSCRYVAPIDGLHKIRQQLLVYRSPDSKPEHHIQKGLDIAAGTCSVAAAGLLVLTIAPISSLVLGVVGIGYGIGRSIGVLHDRSSHEESIGLDNFESIAAWSTIVTSAVTGASSLAVAQAPKIIEAAGEFANVAKFTLNGLNYAALGANLCNFGTYAYFLKQKLANGQDLNTWDYLELGVNLFLAVGAVVNTVQMHKYINSLESTPKTLTERLSRTAKRKLQRLRAKLRNNGGDVSVGGGRADVNEVMILEENVPNWGISFLLNTGQQFLNKHLNIQHIYYKCLEIWQTCCDFGSRKISLLLFVSNMTNHLQNLFIILSETLVSIREKTRSFVNLYFNHRNASDSLNEQIGYMVQNTSKAIKNVDSQFPEDEDEDEDEEQPAENEKPKYEIILETAMNRMEKIQLQNPTASCGIGRGGRGGHGRGGNRSSDSTRPPNNIISAFSTQLSSLIDEITTESNENYEEWISENISLMGRVEAEKVFSNLGIKTVNDFANLNFVSVIENKKDAESICSTVDEQFMQQVFTSYKTILSKIHPENIISELGTLETCQLLKQSVAEFFNPLGQRFEKAKEVYEKNTRFVGSSKAMEMVFTTLKISSRRSYGTDNSSFLMLCMETFDFDQIARLLSTNISPEKHGINKVSRQLDEDNINTTLLLLCDKFYRKVEPKLPNTRDVERENMVKDCYRFLMQNFTTFIDQLEIGQNAQISHNLQLQNSSYFDKCTFVRLYRKVCELKKQQSFASAVEYFTAENNLEALAKKYVATCKSADNSYVPVCNEISAEEDGIRMYSINEGGYLNLRAYKSTAARVLGLNEYQMELITWEKGAVIFKYGRFKNIVFQTVDTKSMYLMEVDLTKQHNLQ